MPLSVSTHCNTKSLFAALLLGTLIGCDASSPTGLKLLNATEEVAIAKDLRLNGMVISTESISIPARSAERYSPEGHAPSIQVKGGELLAATFAQGATSAQASGLLAPRPQGVCQVQATYSGNGPLVCWYDCEVSSSK
jgi:hypothetical protein